MPEFLPVRYLHVDATDAGQRLDNYLLHLHSHLPKSRIYQMIRKGEVRVNQKRAKAQTRLQAGDSLRLPPMQIDESAKPLIPQHWLDDFPRWILWQDEDFLILNKPEGLPVHAGSKQNFGLIDVVKAVYSPTYARLGHRLDRDTSGVILLGKNLKALNTFQNLLRTQRVDKRYDCFVDTLLPQNTYRIEQRLRKVGAAGEERMLAGAEGLLAITEFHVKARYRQGCWLEARLLSGRTHQIRVAAQALPKCKGLAGDRKYGDFTNNRALQMQGLRRLFLHARALSFEFQGRKICVQAPLPAELRAFLDALTPL